MRLRVAMFTVLATLAVPAPAAETLGDGSARKLGFDVFLDDRAVGQQRYEMLRTAAGTRIEIRAAFEVKFLLLTAFAYDHHAVELWRDGCLQTIDTKTDSNGERFEVSGRTRGASFVVETKDGERTLDSCVASFAYWDKHVLLQRRHLLNAQTGEYLPVRIESAGRDRIALGDREVDVERYVITGEGVDITVAYAAEGSDWLALEGRLEGGRILRYRRNDVEPGPRLTDVGRGPGVARPANVQ